MPPTPRWNDLTIGIAALAAILLGALGVLVFGRVGMLHGKTIDVYVSTDAARGVIRGTEVWLDGQRVGTVKKVEFQSPSIAPQNRLVLSLAVLSSAQQHIRLDSKIQVRAGSNVIGDQVVYLTSGTAKMRGVASGDTIHASEQVDYESLGAEFAEGSKEFPAIINNVKLLSAQLQSATGTIGALGVDQGGAEMQQVRAKAARLMSRLMSPGGGAGGARNAGSIGLFMGNSDLLMARARRAMAQSDSIRTLLASNEHSLGRFRRDSTILLEIKRVRAEMSALERQAASPNGTIGRLRSDSAIVRNIHRDLAALDSLIADMKKHPLRYNPF